MKPILTRGRLRERVKPLVRRFRGVSQIHRMAIVYLLAQEPMQVRSIVHALGQPENLVSHHLRQLYTSGWVLKTRTGREVTYRLNEKAFLEFNRLFGETEFYRMAVTGNKP